MSIDMTYCTASLCFFIFHLPRDFFCYPTQFLHPEHVSHPFTYSYKPLTFPVTTAVICRFHQYIFA
ncbi:hypothetical protein DEO72_LG3g1269 [Vigna unguiculata]|uniref:Uncharacterized protein n=1 Tax=Vigna unguiculata TaxID=3917 RepID=A0A4D6LE23_VIGUN|nr:hypothetical protein DEO72_LG3g1269 [Vigna unguiculata]